MTYKLEDICTLSMKITTYSSLLNEKINPKDPWSWTAASRDRNCGLA